MRREQGLLIGVGMQMLSHADNLRMTGSDDRFFSRWSGQQARELRARQFYSEVGAVNTALPGLVAALRSAAVLGIGGSLVLTGQMTLGTLAGFYILGGDVSGTCRALSGGSPTNAKRSQRIYNGWRTFPGPPKIPCSNAEIRIRSRSPRSTAGSNWQASSNCET